MQATLSSKGYNRVMAEWNADDALAAQQASGGGGGQPATYTDATCQSGGTAEGDPSFTIGSQTFTDHIHIIFGKQPSLNGKGFVHATFEGEKVKGTIELTPTKGDCISSPVTKIKGVGEFDLK